MATYQKRPFEPPKCGRCDKPVKWIVEGGVTKYFVGQFCDEHADESIEHQAQYQAALEKRFGAPRR